jgi:ATP-binding cassette subfamily B protein
VSAAGSCRARLLRPALVSWLQRALSGSTVLISLGRSLRIVWRSGPRWSIAAAVLLVAQSILPVGMVYVTKLLVDTVVAGVQEGDKALVLARLFQLLGIALSLQIADRIVQGLARLVQEAHGRVVADAVYGILHAKAIEIDLSHYEDPSYYDVLHRTRQEAPYQPTRILTNMLQMCRNGLSLVGMFALLVAFRWWVPLALCAATLPALLVSTVHTRRMHDWQQSRTQVERQAEYYSELVTTPEYVKEVRLFGTGELFAARFEVLRRRLHAERFTLSRRRFVAETSVGLTSTFVSFGILALLGYHVIHGSVTVGDLVMYEQAFIRGQMFLSATLGGLAGLHESALFLTSFFTFVGLSPTVPEPAHPAPVPTQLREGLAFDSVSFRYPHSDRLVLHDVSFTARPGEVTLIVGQNGAGKTTLIKLLCRLYDPQGGRVTLDGIDLREFRKTDLRRQVSCLFQDHARLHLTACENICLGDTARLGDSAAAMEAANLSGAADCLLGLPDSFDTVLGRRFDFGEELSTGEWQKVALARAFFREAPILVLDEPTSALDGETEAQVLDALRRIAPGRIVILISHRPATFQVADQVLVLEQGRLTERRPADELRSR